MAEHWTKKELYTVIDECRKTFGYAPFPLDARNLVSFFCYRPLVSSVPFSDRQLCGALVREDHNTFIFVNHHHSPGQRNYYCAHELIHYLCHDKDDTSFLCSEASKGRSDVVEWQANEGAAELLMPYRDFIPRYIDEARRHARTSDLSALWTTLAERYGVSPQIVSMRAKSLRYELYQYQNGVALEDIRILSDSRQRFEHLEHLSSEHSFCTSCLSVVGDEQCCPVCGAYLGADGATGFGDGYLKYTSISLNQTGRALNCPSCHRSLVSQNIEEKPCLEDEHLEEEHLEDKHPGNQCPYCGEISTNRCTHPPFTDKRGVVHECGTPSRGDGRHCSLCGAPTTFSKAGILSLWKREFEEQTGVAPHLFFPH